MKAPVMLDGHTMNVSKQRKITGKYGQSAAWSIRARISEEPIRYVALRYTYAVAYCRLITKEEYFGAFLMQHQW